MSMGSEAIDDINFYSMFQEQLNSSKDTWTTKAGEELDIYKMETSHIENVIALCERKGMEAPDLMYRVLEIRKSTIGE